VVAAGAAGTASVEVVKELLARGMQKPPHRVGEKRFSAYSRLLLLRRWRYQQVCKQDPLSTVVRFT
jgi:hypothetical protein